MKFGQLREFNIFFSENHTQHVVNSVPHPFLKNQNWAYLRRNKHKFYSVFIAFPSRGLPTTVLTICFYLI